MAGINWKLNQYTRPASFGDPLALPSNDFLTPAAKLLRKTKESCTIRSRESVGVQMVLYSLHALLELRRHRPF